MARCSMSAAAPAAALLSCGAACPTEASLRSMSRPRPGLRSRAGRRPRHPLRAGRWRSPAVRDRRVCRRDRPAGAQLHARPPRGRSWKCAASRALAGCSLPRSGIFAVISSASACSGTPLRRSIHAPEWRVTASSPTRSPSPRAWRGCGERAVFGTSRIARSQPPAWAVRGRVPAGPRGAPTHVQLRLETPQTRIAFGQGMAPAAALAGQLSLQLRVVLLEGSQAADVGPIR
jgi:hypothetical protein